MPIEDPLRVVRQTQELIAKSKKLHESARRAVEHSRRVKERIAEARMAARKRRPAE